MLSFSIVLPAYNTPPDILRRAINSVLNQTYSSFELIIVDDGSLPSLEPIVKAYNDNRIKYLRHEQNKGAGAAHNTGIRASQFEWVAFICHDDEWLPNKLKRQSEVIPSIQNSEIALIYTDVYFYKNNILTENENIFDVPHLEKYHQNLYLSTLIKVWFATSTIVVRKNALEEITLYDESGTLIDWDLYIRLAQKYSFYGIPEKLVNYYYTPLGITHPYSIFQHSGAGNDIVQLYYKWKKEILKYRRARKEWSIRLNAIAEFFLKDGKRSSAFKLYIEAINLFPIWKGNYIDIIKNFLF